MAREGQLRSLLHTLGGISLHCTTAQFTGKNADWVVSTRESLDALRPDIFLNCSLYLKPLDAQQILEILESKGKFLILFTQFPTPPLLNTHTYTPQYTHMEYKVSGAITEFQ